MLLFSTAPRLGNEALSPGETFNQKGSTMVTVTMALTDVNMALLVLLGEARRLSMEGETDALADLMGGPVPTLAAAASDWAVALVREAQAEMRPARKVA
jgi:hypothetical protein